MVSHFSGCKQAYINKTQTFAREFFILDELKKDIIQGNQSRYLYPQ
jgi:hypothetical protein